MSNMPSGLTRTQVIDTYFLEHRAKVLDLAAFLDRVERAAPDAAGQDFRLAALQESLRILVAPGRDRARRVLEQLSDPTEAPIDAAPQKGACGAAPKVGA